MLGMAKILWGLLESFVCLSLSVLVLFLTNLKDLEHNQNKLLDTLSIYKHLSKT